MSLCCIEIEDSYKLVDNPERMGVLREILKLPEVLDRWEFKTAIENATVDINETGPLLVAAGFRFMVKAFRSSYLDILRREVKTMAADMKLMRRMIYNPETQMLVQVHIPNGFLHEVDDVQVLTDTCTESLQECLAEGWRILCVCPCIDKRRPDYVLGRIKPKASIQRN